MRPLLMRFGELARSPVNALTAVQGGCSSSGTALRGLQYPQACSCSINSRSGSADGIHRATVDVDLSPSAPRLFQAGEVNGTTHLILQ